MLLVSVVLCSDESTHQYEIQCLMLQTFYCVQLNNVTFKVTQSCSLMWGDPFCFKRTQKSAEFSREHLAITL